MARESNTVNTFLRIYMVVILFSFPPDDHDGPSEGDKDRDDPIKNGLLFRQIQYVYPEFVVCLRANGIGGKPSVGKIAETPRRELQVIPFGDAVKIPLCPGHAVRIG